jgi:DNA-binding MarR family transcriptional regulator/GNAT superfamily N-acetyltransferase
MYLDMPYSLTEARLLYEMARRDVTQVTDLRRALDIDAGYLSRVLGRFEADGLVTRQRSAADARRQDVALTSAGLAAAAELNARSDSRVGELLAGVDRPRLVTAMREITDLLGEDGADAPPRARTVVLRSPAPGDLGWVLQRHGAIYAAEYNWNPEFEAYVARIIAGFLTDPRRSAGWIAELDGAPAGFVCCVPEDDAVARLRLLLVEDWARGLGIGGRLVDEVLRFARQAGYERIVLSTVSVLASARRIYQRAGFTLVREQPEHSYGDDLIAEDWARSLSG